MAKTQVLASQGNERLTEVVRSLDDMILATSQDLKREVSESLDLTGLQAAAARNSERIDAVLAESQKALGTLQAELAELTTRKAADNFHESANRYKRRELLWFLGVLLSGVAILWAIYTTYHLDFPKDAVALTVSVVFKRLLVISTPILFLRLCLSKYNLERNLRILYDHRQAVLDQFAIFESAIGDDAPAKNQFRMEVARIVFSDPETGYVAAQAGGELNISPVIGAVEKIGTAAKG